MENRPMWADSSSMQRTRTVDRDSQAAPKRGLGVKILLTSLTVGAIGVVPLLLYILLGPKDGNPVGLGLLAMLAVPLTAIGLLIGAVTAAVEFFIRRKS
jgi:hypothetical protein